MEITTNNAFADEVNAGLSAPKKYLSSKYFYDATGDELFQKIMRLPEYYLTRAEFDILDRYKQDILKPLVERNEQFNLIEMGAGDGLKTRILLRHLYQNQIPFTYYPIDISDNVLNQLQATLKEEFPGLPVKAIQGTYHEALEARAWDKQHPSLMLFLGSNMGNFLEGEALSLLDELSNALRPGEMLLAGFDLKKDPEVILNAYNDDQGVTSAFNLNLLQRINRELGGDFDASKFKHWPIYDPVSGECKSYLVSTEKQEVKISQIGAVFHFEAHEAIFTEVSKKYSLPELERYALAKRFEVEQNFLDDKKYFTDSMWRKMG
ncbi:MAG TPA: L-histidine N(alpha)-methyltransferase [Cyclobacteriaceae bacterium]|nr:L-histidine N(alpha)-methyltransferase [Cyclobacteriaceae bacterium]